MTPSSIDFRVRGAGYTEVSRYRLRVCRDADWAYADESRRMDGFRTFLNPRRSLPRKGHPCY